MESIVFAIRQMYFATRLVSKIGNVLEYSVT